MEQFVWTNDLRDIEESIKNAERLRDKKRHAAYYKKNRKKILKKQKKADEIRDRKSKQYYKANKERILTANLERYYKNREERLRKQREYYQRNKVEINKRRKEKRMVLTNTERVRALLGNLKNWSWDVNPQFRIEKEEAEALITFVKNEMDKDYANEQRSIDSEKNVYTK